MSAGPLQTSKSIDGLQYLRGIAALMVVLFHARSYFTDLPAWTGVGARGVDIFFVISGFIMAYTTREIGRDVSAVKASLLFLFKRIIRVVPLYWIALLWTSAPYWLNWFSTSNSLAQLYSNISPELISIGKDFLFIPHLSLDEGEEGEIFPILLQGWTLNFEMVFYALFAVCMLFRSYRLLAASTVLVTLVVVGKAHKFSDLYGIVYTSSIWIEFVFGMMVFWLHQRAQHLTFERIPLILLGVIGFLLLNTGSHGNDKLVLAVASSMVVLAFVFGFQGVRNSVLKLLGDASYSIYLFHAAAFVPARALIHFLEIGSSGYLNVLTIVLVQVAYSIVIGIAVYFLIEKPLLKLLRHLFARAVSRWQKKAPEYTLSREA